MSWTDILIAVKKGIVASKEELSKYLPLAGGNIDGRLGVESTEAVSRVLSVKNAVKGIAVHVNPQGQAGLWDGANAKWVIVSDSEGDVTVNGISTGNVALIGTAVQVVNAPSVTPLGVNNTHATSTSVVLDYLLRGTRLGRMGFDGKDKPVFIDSSNNVRRMHHEGNKPSGTYNGNGSATARTVATGGIGDMLLLYSDDMQKQAIVTPLGAFTFENNEVNLYPKTKIYYTNGTLYLTNTELAFNKSGTTYTYRCI